MTSDIMLHMLLLLYLKINKKLFQQLLAKDKNKILRKDAYAKIISKVTRKYCDKNCRFIISFYLIQVLKIVGINKPN